MKTLFENDWKETLGPVFRLAGNRYQGTFETLQDKI